MADESGSPPGSQPVPEDEHTGLRPDEQPGAGTLFIMLVFLMALAALWAIMYVNLLER